MLRAGKQMLGANRQKSNSQEEARKTLPRLPSFQRRWKCEGAASGHTRRPLWSSLRNGTAHLRGTTDSRRRENFSCREDERSLLTLGRLHVFGPNAESPEPARAGKVVRHMASIVPMGSQRRLATPPTHLLLSGAKQSRSPCWLHFLTNTPAHKHGAAQRNVISLASEPMLKLFLGVPACFTLAV